MGGLARIPSPLFYLASLVGVWPHAFSTVALFGARAQDTLLYRFCNGAVQGTNLLARDVKPAWGGPALADASAQPRSARMWERQHPPFDLPRGVPSRPGPARRSHGDDPPTSRQKRGRTAHVRAVLRPRTARRAL